MSEVKRLSKADILNGNKNVTYTFFEELGGELPLRSLTDGQWAQIEAVKTRGSKMKGIPIMGKDGNPDLEKSQMGIEIDMEQMTLAEFEADCLAVSYGIASDERWTLDEVKSITPPGVIHKIAKKIYSISGIVDKKTETLHKLAQKQLDKEEEDIKSFRTQ